jgi:tRNA dimethylallyltransferase
MSSLEPFVIASKAACPEWNEGKQSIPPMNLPLIVILGPTAVGKTALAIQLAARLRGEIISADSRLFYIGMDIGTAKPSLAERQQVPHHLIDVALPDQIWSLAVYQQEAQRIIQEVTNRGCLPFLVGGTGQYIHAVTQSWHIPRVEPDPHLRRALEHWAAEITPLGLHARLEKIDPLAASRIDPQNLRRTIRALEVILVTGQLFSRQSQRGPSPYHLLQIGLKRPRPELYVRIDERIDLMLSAGLVDEVQALLAQGYSPDLPSLSAIGYREVIAYLQGKTTLEEAIMLIKRQTRLFVRRQANWFKESDPIIHWFTVHDQTIDEMEALVRQWLAR